MNDDLNPIGLLRYKAKDPSLTSGAIAIGGADAPVTLLRTFPRFLCGLLRAKMNEVFG